MRDLIEEFKDNEERFLFFTENSVRFSHEDLSRNELALLVNSLKDDERQSLGRQKMLSDVLFSMSPKDFSLYKRLKFDTYEEYLDFYEEETPQFADIGED